jgi:outer membrane immunogenic protein
MSFVVGALVSAAAIAQAADMGSVPPSPGAPPVVAGPVPFSWTGFYVGVNGGYGLARDQGVLRDVATAPGGTLPLGTVDFNETSNQVPAGAFGGGQVGYNRQMDHVRTLGQTC